MTIVLGLSCVVLVSLCVALLVDVVRVRRRYKPVIDVDREIASRRRALEAERAEAALEIARLHSAAEEANARARRDLDDIVGRQRVLQADYAAAKGLYDRLSLEVKALEENLEDISFGLYRPHYDFDSPERYKRQLDQIRERQKNLVRSDGAIRFLQEWTVNGSAAQGRKMQKQQAKLMLRAFNGEVEAAIGRVTWNNATRMEERIRKAFEQVNQQGTVMHAAITSTYLDLALEELRLEHELEEKRRSEAEEQRRIKEQMREEERALREAQKAQEEAEAEEGRYEKALAKARSDIAKARGAELDKLNAKLAQLESALAEAHRKKERALSMAQQTKSGHVYIISNIGSFGDNVFKIGMTRRLEPGERIKELGDASVPFEFDVHAMVYTEDAPGLENAFHRHFAERRMNLVNARKEFFAVTIDEIEQFATSRGLVFELTKLAEAREYRETMTIRAEREVKPKPPAAFPEMFPVSVG